MKHQRLLNSANSRSEPNLATGDKAGFPPGTTVDELWHYRRKKALDAPHDNLHLLEGTFHQMKTEYVRRYKNYHSSDILERLNLTREDISPVRSEKHEDTFKLEGDIELHTETGDKFVEFPWEKPQRGRPVVGSFEVIDFGERRDDRPTTESLSQYQEPPLEKRKKFGKKPTNLKLEGDFHSTTEQADQFVQFLLGERAKQLRRPTTLRMEGDMGTKTENRDQFIAYDPQPRPPLCKKLTNLHLDGEHHILSEKQEQFVPFAVKKRPPLTKASTNLHIEGDLDLVPEYRREFIEFKSPERRHLALPVNNLKTDGFFDVASNVSAPFQQAIHPQIPFLRGGEEFGIRSRRESFFKSEGPMETVTENKGQFVEKTMPKTERRKATGNLHLEGQIDMKPEYRNAYIDFNKVRGSSPIKSRRASEHSSLKSEGKMEISPEYSSTFVEFPRERPRVKRPECSLSSEGEIDHLTEQHEKFVPFPNVKRADSLKREPELKLEGNFECQPEYRKAYIDYLIRERIERKHRPLDNLGTTQRAVEVDPAEKSNTLAVPPPVYPGAKKNGSKPEQKSAKSHALTQIENTVFGPKLKPSSSSSRSSSPNMQRRKSQSLPRTRATNYQTSTDSDNNNNLQVSRRFGSSVRVENLANRPPLPATASRLDVVSAKNKWMRDSSMESTNSAFVVLDNQVNGYGGMQPSNKKWGPAW